MRLKFVMKFNFIFQTNDKKKKTFGKNLFKKTRERSGSEDALSGDERKCWVVNGNTA